MKYILNTLVAAAALVAFTACDDNDDWTPGEEVSEDSPAVFFADDNTFTHEFETSDHTFKLHVKRLNATKAVTVPLVTDLGDKNIIVPESVSFEAGQTDAYFTVDCTDIPTRTQFKCNISIGDGYNTPYGAGSDIYNGTVAVVVWELVDDSASFWYYDTGDVMQHPATYSEFWYLDGSNINGAVKLKFTNFLGSGKDFVFYLDSTQSGCSETYIGIQPMLNYKYDAGNTDYGCWYFYDEANDEYPSWDLEDGFHIDYCYVYGVGYTYLNLKNESGPYGCISCYLTPDVDTWADYFQVWFYVNIPDELKDVITYAK